MQADLIRVRASVRGRVQMVGFREFTVRNARAAGLAGSVANRPDGSVECVVEGPRAAVEDLLRLLREGPRAARVDSVATVSESPKGELPPMRVTA